VARTAAKKSTATLRGRLQQVSVGLPPELVEQLEAIAARESRSRGKVIELLLRDALHQRAGRRAA
jgi:metal-responsive CopG/Arc/MetJ family transcriptional regulator